MSGGRTAFVTGATGFVGINLVRELRARGWRVRALRRANADVSPLDGVDVEWVEGDVTDRPSVFQAMPHAPDAVFHVAASTSMWRLRDDEQYAVNVLGTDNVVDAALWRRARRFIHTSSVAAFGPRDGDVLREDQPSRAADHWVNYFRTKWLAERQVESAVRAGLDAVILNPGNILGPYELHNWSRFLGLVARGRLLRMLPGAAPWSHVRSVVDMHLAAFERGRSGHRYLLGSVTASYAEVAAELHRLVGGKRPPGPAPRWLFAFTSRVAELLSHVTRRSPQITPAAAHLTSLRYACDCAKAQAELGYRETSLREMVADTHAWMVSARS
jgi:nucleoside-diphosphate-sugar epimerase